MKRRLILMRHAKSSWKSDAPTDHARPLNRRGRRDAPRVARRLVELGWVPERTISSDSARTRETFQLMSDQLPSQSEVRFTGALYHADVTALCSQLAEVPTECVCVLALGHNPGWEDAAEWLTGQPIQMTTANAALLESAGSSWALAVQEPACWHLRELIRPKELGP
jgi:phosphohistidine phosphatase SixA